ncbi:porin PorA family protein [Gordonia sp. (in: high G+C Gram-positive bacteria)]|uniref:porin PorA family protein n=1 Tax=Gordonia sp. (in: high G+C Gram-positive bacteria) TaxID=84139 RepID=UPI003C71AC7A
MSYPAVSKLPGDLDTTAHYTGTATLLNSKALEAGDVKNAVAKNVPVTIDRRIHVTGTDGDNASVDDNSTMKGPGGIDVSGNAKYVIDRTTMEAASGDHGGDVEPAEGLVFTLPLHPEQRDYTVWVSDLQSAEPLKYLGEATVEGRDVYKYQVKSTGPLKNPALLKTLPPALPKALVEATAQALPAQTRDSLLAALPSMPANIPLTYVASADVMLFADKTLGVPLSSETGKGVVANVKLADGTMIPLLPIVDVKAASTPESIANSVSNANSKAKALSAVSMWLPLGLLVLGLLLLVAAWLRRVKPVAA